MEEKSVNYTSIYYTKCTIYSPTDVSFSPITGLNGHLTEPFDYEDIEKLEIDISLEDVELSEESMVAAGREVTEMLQEIPHIKALHLRYLQRPFAEYLFEHFIREVKSNTISILKIFFNDQLECFYQNVPSINGNNFLNGFENLKIIKIVLIYDIFHSDLKELIDAASVIKGITIEILQEYSFNSIRESLYKKKFINNNSACICKNKFWSMDILSYIIKKRIHLSIPKTKPNYFNFNEWFPNLKILDFTLIRRLHLKLSSYIDLRNLAAFLPFMANLELLSLHIDVNTDCILYQPNNVPHEIKSKWVKLCPEMANPESKLFDSIIMKESKSHSYKSFKFLRNLKTIQLTLDIFNPSNGHLVFEPYHKNPPIVKKYKRLYDNEIFSFLSKAPKSIENLYLRRIPRIKCLTTFLLNEYFPNLNFLCLGEICNIEKECLTNLKNLKIFVSYYKNIFELPENIKIFMACINYFASTKELELDKKLFSDYYKYLKRFSKEYTLNGSIKGKIFFNHLQDYDTIKCYFSDIEEMTFGR